MVYHISIRRSIVQACRQCFSLYQYTTWSIRVQLAFLTPRFLGYFFANPASVTPGNGDILLFYECMMVNLLCK
jgi:hypothetical protein